MLKWIFTFVAVLSSLVLGYMYIQLEEISITPEITPLPQTNAIRIVDAYADGVHRYSGQVRLAHSCYAVATTIRSDLKDANTVVIMLTSKDKMLDEKLCAQIPTGYPFREVYEGGPDMKIKLLLDEKELPTRVIKTAWQNPAGDVINTLPTQK